MKLTAKTVPYSSIVGGGLLLVDETGAGRFQVMFIGTTAGITRAEAEALSQQFARFIEELGLQVPDRE